MNSESTTRQRDCDLPQSHAPFTLYALPFSRRQITAVLFALLLTSLGGTRSSPAQGVGDPAPEFSCSTLAAGDIALSDYDGKVVFLFFLGWNCPFCKEVGNRTQTEVYDRFFPSGEFQAIGLDTWDGSAAQLQSFRDFTGVTYPLCLQQSQTASQDYHTTYDRIMVVDQDGVIQFRGTSTVENTLDDAVAVIMDLISTSSDVDDEPAADYALVQNYPNPFDASTTIDFAVPQPGRAALRIYDALGRHVRTLVDRTVASGRHTVDWDGTDGSGQSVRPGLYFYRLESGDFSQTRAMMLVW